MVQPGHPAQFSKGGRRLFPLPHFACPSEKTGSCRSVNLVRCPVVLCPLRKDPYALRAIFHGGSPYDFKIDNETLASYQLELVSILDSIHGCPRLLDILDGNDRLYLEENSELMLRPAHEVCEESLIQPYWGTKLRHYRNCYNQLVGRLADIGFFTYTLHPACTVGVFFVYKSNRTKLRLITDARRSNAFFKEAPGVSFMAGEGMVY